MKKIYCIFLDEPYSYSKLYYWSSTPITIEEIESIFPNKHDSFAHIVNRETLLKNGAAVINRERYRLTELEENKVIED